MSPGISIGKNAVLLLLCIVAWWGSYHRATKATERYSRWTAVGIKLVFSMAVAAGVDGYAYSNMETIDENVPRPFAQFVFEANGLVYDLGKGTYLVPMMSMTCEHCMASVEAINDLTIEAGTPRIVALCYEENEGELETFCETTGAVFPLYSLEDRVRTFFDLAPIPPRFYLVRDGVVLRYWDEEPPAAAEILNLMARLHARHNVPLFAKKDVIHERRRS
jgi:hypothetical protein